MRRLLAGLDRRFFSSFWSLTLPIALQNLIISALNLADTMLVGELGEKAIGAVAVANQVYFLFVLVLFGIATGSAVFTAQYWGSRDMRAIQRALGFCLALSLSAATLFGLAGLLAPRQLLGLFSSDQELVGLGMRFLPTASAGYWFTAVSFAYANVLRSMRVVRSPLVVSGAALAVNTLLNWLLISGRAGFPAMGVAGSALATLIARALEAALLLAVVYRRAGPLREQARALFSVSRDYMRRYARVALPVVVNEFVWALGFVTYGVVYARMGTDALAAFSLTDTVAKLGIVLFFGTSNACSVMVGNAIGAGDCAGARLNARAFSLLGPALGAAVGLVVMALSGALPSIFRVSPAVRADVSAMLVIFALFLPAKVFNWQLVVGILRAGGDTRFSLFLEAGTVWLFGVPLAALAGLVLRLPVALVFLAANLEELLKLFIGLPRLLSGKWLNDLTRS